MRISLLVFAVFLGALSCPAPAALAQATVPASGGATSAGAAKTEAVTAQPAAAPATAKQPATRPTTTASGPAKPRAHASTAATAGGTAAKADAVTTAWQVLNDGLTSGKYESRSDALSALVVLSNDQRAVGMIEKALTDKSTRIRVLAAVSLGEIEARSAIPALRVALDDKSPEVSFAAAQALWKMGDRSGRKYFYEVLEGDRKTQPGFVQGHLTKARRDLQDPKAMAFIGVNAASGAFLGPGALGVSAIEEFAVNKSAPVQALCAKLLSEDDTPETVRVLKEALNDKNWIIRAAAARSLAAMKHTDALPQLQVMMATDKKQSARFSAAAAVIRLSKSAA